MKPEWRDAEDREEGRADADILVGGGAVRELTDRLQARWRRYLPLTVALVVGLAAGGYGGYAWLVPLIGARDDVPALTARVSGPRALYLPYPPYRVSVEVHNRGQQPVTVRRTRLELPGYRVVLGLSNHGPCRATLQW